MARRLITPKGKQSRLEGMAELQEKLAKIMNATTARDVKKVYMAGALMLRDRARELAPVKSGTLQSAIFAAYGKDSRSDVIVGVNRKAFYAAMVEYGTVKAPAHPFMRPALRQIRGSVVSRIAEGLRQIILENAQ